MTPRCYPAHRRSEEPCEGVPSRELVDRVAALLDDVHVMTLATTHQYRPWACTLAFARDEWLNLYFVSRRSTMHVTQIRSNPEVAVALHDRERGHRTPSSTRGLQLWGTARLLDELAPGEERRAASLYLARFPKAERRLRDHVFRDRTACLVRIRVRSFRLMDAGAPNSGERAYWMKPDDI